MEKMHKHHMIPLSLGIMGIDCPCNLISLTEKQHLEVHKTLNFGYYHMRQHYKTVNGSLDIAFIFKEQEKMVRLYFKPFEKMSAFLRKAHLEKMREQVTYVTEQHKVVYGNYDKNGDFRYQLDVLIYTYAKQTKG